MVRIGKTPVLFYKKKIVVTGVKSLEELKDTIKKLMNIIHGYGIEAKPEGYEIINITAKTELGRRINLVKASMKLNGIYDPDYRPYLMARINEATLMLTHNGKLVVLGAKNIEHVEEILIIVGEKLGIQNHCYLHYS